jgi:hypothetical protein
MAVLRRILDFYIEGSIHVALSCAALVLMTQHMFDLPQNLWVVGFTFFGTIVGYNFVKYDALARTGKLPIKKQLKAIIALSVMVFFAVALCFFKLQRPTQLTAILFLGLTILYTLPFFPNRKNARNWKGVKIYMVALCWVGATVVLPILDSGIVITSDFWVKCVQRFLLLFSLILVFEINDLKNDDPNLKTVPQQIGVKRTKILGVGLLAVFYFLEFLKRDFETRQLLVNAIIVPILAFLLYFSSESRNKYYTSFYAESVPILWWLLVVVSGCV